MQPLQKFDTHPDISAELDYVLRATHLTLEVLPTTHSTSLTRDLELAIKNSDGDLRKTIVRALLRSVRRHISSQDQQALGELLKAIDDLDLSSNQQLVSPSEAAALKSALSHRVAITHMKLVYAAAAATREFERTLPYDERIQCGWDGLTAAVAQYDPARGYTFSTYARRRIVGAIQDAHRKLVLVSRHRHSLNKLYNSTWDRLAQIKGEAPTDAEVSEMCGITRSELDQSPIYIADESRSDIDVDIKSSENTEIDAIEGMTAELVAEVMSQLPQDDANAVALVWMAHHNVTEASNILGIQPHQLRAALKRSRVVLTKLLWELRPEAA